MPMSFPRAHPLLLVAALVAAEACGGTAPIEQAESSRDRAEADDPTPSSGRSDPGWRYSVPSRAPDPLACEEDDDCVVDSYPFDDRGCCLAFAAPMSRAYRAWHLREVIGACPGGVPDCTHASLPTDSPSQPLPCYFEPRCRASVCGSACGEP